MSNQNQLALFGETYRIEPKLKSDFLRFDSANPTVWDMFIQFTFDAIRAGHKKYSVASVVERIRWQTDIVTTGSKFKISNAHRAFYARKFHELYPQHDGFFRTKPSVADQ